MFDGLAINILVLLASLLVLTKASHVSITNTVKLADATGFGRTTIGFLLVAFATSLPELIVSILAVLGGGSGEGIGVAVGNVIGSNIMNVCLILGLCIIIAARKNTKKLELVTFITKEESGSLYFGLFMASFIPLVLMYIREAGRFVGVILLTLFVYNTYHLSRERSSSKEEPCDKECKKTVRYLIMTLIGVAGIVGSAYFLIESASYIALAAGVPAVVIGATVIAFGTSVPELATSIEATKQGHLNLAYGNIIGSGFLNMTCILGVTLAFSSLNVNMVAFNDLVIFSLISNLLLWYSMSSGKVGWREGIVLLTIYALFLALSFGIITTQ
jgi:cation:H+ antiporter